MSLSRLDSDREEKVEVSYVPFWLLHILGPMNRRSVDFGEARKFRGLVKRGNRLGKTEY